MQEAPPHPRRFSCLREGEKTLIKLDGITQRERVRVDGITKRERGDIRE